MGGCGGRFFKGQIDEGRLLNRVLGPDEIAADYYSGGQRYSTTLVSGPYTYIVNPASISGIGSRSSLTECPASS